MSDNMEKLTSEQLMEIRKQKEDGNSFIEIANNLKVPIDQIIEVINAPLDQKPLCACGCGEEVRGTYWDVSKQMRVECKYIAHHNLKMLNEQIKKSVTEPIPKPTSSRIRHLVDLLSEDSILVKDSVTEEDMKYIKPSSELYTKEGKQINPLYSHSTSIEAVANYLKLWLNLKQGLKIVDARAISRVIGWQQLMKISCELPYPLKNITFEDWMENKRPTEQTSSSNLLNQLERMKIAEQQAKTEKAERENEDSKIKSNQEREIRRLEFERKVKELHNFEMANPQEIT